MADINAAREKPVEQFYDQVEGVHAGMLGISGSSLHMQPMAPQLDRADRTIYFFTQADAALVKELKPGAAAHFTLVGKDHDYHACVSGPLERVTNRAKIDEHWNTVADAWFEGGKDDPDLVMLGLRLKDGEAWASTDSGLRFGWEIAKAELFDGEKPDVGIHVPLTF